MVFGILGVLLTVRQNVWCWPAGIVNVLLFTLVFFHARLYGSSALQVVYLVLSVYGWRQWLHGGTGHGRLAVSRTPRAWAVALGVSGLLAAAVLGYLLSSRTNAALPYLDAATTTFSLVAQWMTTRKWVENWWIWIGVDVVYVGMYTSQRLYPTSVLYTVFLGLAVLGWREWRRSMGQAPPQGAGA